MTRKIFLFLIITIALTGCATFGTNTLYKSEEKIEIKKLGFAKLDGDSIVSKIFPQTDSIFTNTFVETFKTYNLKDIVPFNSEFSIDKPDINTIVQICKENNLDGFVVSRLKFIHVTYSMSFIPIAKNWDTEVELKLFNKIGNIILTVRHNTTRGNSYFMPPSANRTIHDGTAGAIKRLAKELGMTK
jgi:hypothetical protein